MSADITAVPERHKRWHSKTREGCLLCKKRRVKCDNAKPKCKNCLRREEDCEYETMCANALVWQTFENYPLPHRNRFPSHWNSQKCSNFEFFLENSIPRPCDVPRNSDGARSFSQIWSLFWGQAHQSQLEIVSDPFDRLFADCLLQLSFHHPLISDLVCLYAIQQRILLELHQYDVREACLSAYAKSVSIVRKLLMTETDNAITATAPLILFAFERTATIFSPSKDGQFHVNAVLKLNEQVDDHPVVEQYLRPLSQIMSSMTQIFRMNGQQLLANNSGTTSVNVPQVFTSCEQAREVLYHAYRMRTRCTCSPRVHWTPACPAFVRQYQVFKAWIGCARAYYLSVRGHNIREAKLVFVLLVQYQLMEFCLERSATQAPE